MYCVVLICEEVIDFHSLKFHQGQGVNENAFHFHVIGIKVASMLCMVSEKLTTDMVPLKGKSTNYIHEGDQSGSFLITT